MTSRDLAEQLLSLTEIEAQRRFLEEHASLLDDAVASALKDRADHLLRADATSALKVVNLLYLLAEYSGDPTHRCLGLRAEGNVRCIALGEYQRAIDMYDEAARTYQEQGCLVEQAQSLVGKLWALTNLGRYAEAFQVGDWASRVLEEHGEWRTLAVLTMNIGIVHSRAGDDAASLEMFDRAEALYQQAGAEGELYWYSVAINRAFALRTLGRFEEAIQAAQVAWEGLTRSGQRVEAARARQNLALTYFVLGRYNEALDHLDQVRDVFMDDGRQRDAMRVELFVSDCLLQLRRFGEVLEKCQRARTLFAELGTRDIMAQAIANEAVAYAELGRYPEALASLAEARQIFDEAGNHTRVAYTDMESAALLLRQGRHEQGMSLAEECAAVFKDYDLSVEEAQAYLLMAGAALALKRYDRALSLVKGALEVAETRNIPSLKYQGHHLVGMVEAACGDQKEALAAFDQAIEEVERLRGRLMLEHRVSFLEDKARIYEDSVALCLDLDKPLQGLEYAERAKSRALLDLLAYRLDLGIQARDSGDLGLVEELTGLRVERDRLYRRLESDWEPGMRGWVSVNGDRAQAQQEILDLERRITGLWHTLLIRNADYARDAALWTVRAEPVQPHLSSDTILVEYFVARNRLLVFLVTADAVQARWLESDLARIQTLTQYLWLNLRTVSRSNGDKRATKLASNARGLFEALYQELMAPLADTLEAYRRLIIVPHGPLHYLPFHALHDGSAFMVKRFEISYLPGSSLLRYCQEVQAENRDMLAVGHSNGGRLPYAVQEARSVATLMGGQALLDDEATPAEVQHALPNYRTLHLAAHGDFRPDNPLFSGLALANGWLTTLDIFNLRLRASLVTLSACQTGRNVVGGGDELLGLMRAFLGAGTASLVLSLWAVEDRSTARLMETFYEKLAGGCRKGAALRAAQLGLLNGENGREDPDCSHPYYWAPFFLVGDPGPL